MTQEDKELLLKDLCARLPYGVKAQIKATNCIDGTHTLSLIDLNSFIGNRPRDKDWYDIVTSIKPYLRPMSSMTEEEEEERQELWHSSFSPTEYATLFLDFCNERHLDYRGLIEKGLAIEVTKDNNPYKD